MPATGMSTRSYSAHLRQDGSISGEPSRTTLAKYGSTMFGWLLYPEPGYQPERVTITDLRLSDRAIDLKRAASSSNHSFA